MKPHKEFPCENKTQLAIEEERVRVEMNADLNMQSCFGRDKEAGKEKRKEHYEKNKEEILEKMKEKTICECGCEVILSGLPRHKRSAKHKKLMQIKMENLVL